MEELEEYPGESFADKVTSFLLSTGVTQAEIDSIRNIFLVWYYSNNILYWVLILFFQIDIFEKS